MPTYKFSDIAINITDKRMPVPEDRFLYIAPNNLETETLTVPEFGYKVDLNGTKLIMHKGDMLFGRREPQLKHAAIAPHDGLFSAHGMIFHPRENVISKEFFPFFISSDYFFDEAIRISVGSLSPTVNWKDLKDVEFTIPSLEDQERYAEILWAIVNSKKAYKKVIAATDELVKSQFIELFGNPEDNNCGWNMGTIRDIVSEVRYGSSRQASPDGKYPYIRMNNITYSGELDLTDIKRINIPDNELAKCTVRKGDVLFNRTNSKELVGKTCLYDRDETMVLAGFVIRVRMNEKAYPEFLVQYMNMPYIKELLFGMCKAACGQANINAQELQNIPIYIPPIDLQKRFIQLKEQTDKSKFEAKKAIEELNNLQKKILLNIFGD